MYNQNEINGKFKIMMGWDEKFNDPESEEYKSLANSIENDLEDMLRKERDLSDQVESFTVKVQKLRRGSVVCDFKVIQSKGLNQNFTFVNFFGFRSITF